MVGVGQSFNQLGTVMALLGERFDAVGMCRPLALRFCVLASRKTILPVGAIADSMLIWWNSRINVGLFERWINRSKALRFLALNCLTGSVFWDHAAKRLYKRYWK